MPDRTVYYAEDKKLLKKQVPVPEIGPHDVLFETKAIGFNPTEYKHLDYQMSDGTVLGSEGAGKVIKVGSDVSNVKVGDTIAAIACGGTPEIPLEGSYASVIKVEDHDVLTFPKTLKQDSSNEIPSGVPTTFEQAASLPVGLLTATLAFVGYNDTPLIKDSKKGYALVYGAVGSLGFQATQLAHYVGYDVIAVASKKHTELLNSIGITHIVDYHDEDWVEQARKIGGDDIVYAYDTISFDENIKKVLEALSDTKPAKLNLSLPGKEKVASKPNVEIDVPLGYLLDIDVKKFGSTVCKAPQKVIDRRGEIAKSANKLLADNYIKTLPIKIVGDGIDDITKGVDAIRKGVSATKIVLRV